MKLCLYSEVFANAKVELKIFHNFAYRLNFTYAVNFTIHRITSLA